MNPKIAQILQVLGLNSQDLMMFAPAEAIGRDIRLGGWGCQVVPAFRFADVQDPERFAAEFGEGRVLIRFKNPSSLGFSKRLTGPDSQYHGIWATDRPIPASGYEVVI